LRARPGVAGGGGGAGEEGENRIVGYVVAQSGASSEELRNYLKEKLPELHGAGVYHNGGCLSANVQWEDR